MFRRRSPSASPRPAPDAGAPAGASASDHLDLAADLEAAGWLLPRGLTGDGPPRWTLVGTVASPTATPVDAAGLVVGEGWSLDWWVGADDRWHLPAREAAVRQQLVGGAPVVETLLRVPGGDAAHRAYGVRAPREVGDEWVVVEVENRTPVPFAVAFVIRPFVADGVGAVSEVTVEPVDGGRGRDVAHLVRVDGRPAVVLPRRPARLASGDDESGDALHAVIDGSAGTDLVAASCADGLATLALVLPVPHTATVRVVVPVGDVGPGPVGYPSVLPDAATVVAGWEVHRRGPRLVVPDRRVGDAVDRARAHLELAHDGVSVRRDGHRAADLEPGATEVLLGALDLFDRPADVGAVVARWTDRLADPAPEIDALFLAVVARHWLLHRDDALLNWMLPEVAAAVERLDRADRRGRLGRRASRRRAAAGLAAASTMLAAAGQPDAGVQVQALADRVGADLEPSPPTSAAEHLQVAATHLAAGGPEAVAAWDDVVATVGLASATGTWPGPGPGGRPVGHDLAADAALVMAARSALVSERPDGLALLPVHPDGWYGGAVEVHDAPTSFGRLSYAVRWHGTRPALLWDLEPHPGTGPVRLTVPGLDPAWSTTERRGDALLAEVAPPVVAEPLLLVAEHPDIDPVMRRPGSTPDEPTPAPPEGGSFS